MKIALGPVLTCWEKAHLDAFYAAASTWPVDIVYLGEVVCSRRHEYRLADWIDAADALAAAGKEVVLSAQALMESESDLKTLRRIVANGRYMVEANDMGAVHLLADHAPFVAGPHLNVYNTPTLSLLSSLGAVRWVPPVEMTQASLAAILAHAPAGLATEVFAWGRLPLAFSARCFTARHYDLPKDDCRFVCVAHPDGLTLATKDGEPFLVLNGIQTQSHRVHSLVAALPDLARLGVDALRVSPQAGHTGEIVAALRAALDGRIAPSAAEATMAALSPAPPCNGYWHDRPGLDYVTDAIPA
ncbi:MAG: U32 family peptidase [Betaproteobacteria bacterium]